MDTPATTTTTTSTSFTVGDTFGAMRALHAAEIEQGTLAMNKATDKGVKEFAEKVVNDHKARMQKDNKIMSSLGIAPTDNSVSQQINAASAQQAERLNSLSGADFDRAYIEQQINYYRNALDIFDRNLLPNVRDPQIKANVTEARSRANDHLKEAQDLRLTLSKQ
jgi:putative membrane protein